MPELAAAVVILKDRFLIDRVLVVRRSWTERFLPGQWGVPCGKVDQDEASRSTVLRELFEETGLNGEVVSHVGQSNFPSVWRGRPVENTQNNYLVDPDTSLVETDKDGMPKIKVPKNDQEAKWVPTYEIEGFGLDLHNLGTIRQGLHVHVRNQLVNAVSNAPS
jgi:8-oxo-dGTP diphosphatase